MKPKFRLRSKFKKLINVQKHVMTLLYKKRNLAYNSSRDTWNTKIINDIVHNKKTSIVSQFKDNLITYDNSECLKRSYSFYESSERLNNITNFSQIYKEQCPLFRAYSPHIILMKGIKRKLECDIEFECRLIRKLRFGMRNEENIFDDRLKKSIDNIQLLPYDYQESKEDVSTNSSLLSVCNLLRSSIEKHTAKAVKLAKSPNLNKYKLFKDNPLIMPSASQANLHFPKASKSSALNLNSTSIKLPISPSNRNRKLNKVVSDQKVSIIRPPSSTDIVRLHTEVNNCKQNKIESLELINEDENCINLLRTQRNLHSEILPMISNQCSTFTNSLNSVPSSQSLRESATVNKLDIKAQANGDKVKSKFFTFDTPISPAKAVKSISPTKFKIPATFRKNSSISIKKLNDQKSQANLINSQGIAKRFSILPSKVRFKSTSTNPNQEVTQS